MNATRMKTPFPTVTLVVLAVLVPLVLSSAVPALDAIVSPWMRWLFVLVVLALVVPLVLGHLRRAARKGRRLSETQRALMKAVRILYDSGQYSYPTDDHGRVMLESYVMPSDEVRHDLHVVVTGVGDTWAYLPSSTRTRLDRLVQGATPAELTALFESKPLLTYGDEPRAQEGAFSGGTLTHAQAREAVREAIELLEPYMGLDLYEHSLLRLRVAFDLVAIKRNWYRTHASLSARSRAQIRQVLDEVTLEQLKALCGPAILPPLGPVRFLKPSLLARLVLGACVAVTVAAVVMGWIPGISAALPEIVLHPGVRFLIVVTTWLGVLEMFGLPYYVKYARTSTLEHWPAEQALSHARAALQLTGAYEGLPAQALTYDLYAVLRGAGETYADVDAPGGYGLSLREEARAYLQWVTPHQFTELLGPPPPAPASA